MSNYQLTKIVESNNDKPVKQGISKIVTDENGLIAIQELKLNDNEELIQSFRLTGTSLNRALIENIASSYIAEIDTILKATLEDAQRQAEENARQHLTNRLGEINNLVADFKERSLERQKEYISPKKDEPSIWATPIDFYNMGEPIEGDGSLGGDSSTVETEAVDEEQSFDI